MDIILAVAVIYLCLIPIFGGLVFFFGGISTLLNFDPDYDELEKKHSAILDVVLGAALLLLFNLFFWLVIYPAAVFNYNLNLPVFVW